MSYSAVSKTIFEIKATEDKTKISTPIVPGSGKNVISFGSLETCKRTLDIRMNHKVYNFTIIIYY